jgi:hypothetical protein
MVLNPSGLMAEIQINSQDKALAHYDTYNSKRVEP